MIIAIDGPCGAGKSTVADQVAKNVGFLRLDTGAMFRALAYWAIKNNIDFFDEQSLTDIALNNKITFENDKNNISFKRIYIGNLDATDFIRTDEVNKAVTPICKHPGVRSALLSRQREIANKGDYVLDGRDIGTIVFPNAQLKIYLTADIDVRAKRRFIQNLENGINNISFEDVLHDLNRRDLEDKNRKVAPLKIADDAIYIDSSNMSETEVVNKICSLVNNIKG